MRLLNYKNIVLIGMPGAGKSTIGVILAKSLLFDFCDTDLSIQRETGESLCDTISKIGINGFIELEDDCGSKTQLCQRQHGKDIGENALYAQKADAQITDEHRAGDKAQYDHQKRGKYTRYEVEKGVLCTGHMSNSYGWCCLQIEILAQQGPDSPLCGELGTDKLTGAVPFYHDPTLFC